MWRTGPGRRRELAVGRIRSWAEIHGSGSVLLPTRRRGGGISRRLCTYSSAERTQTSSRANGAGGERGGRVLMFPGQGAQHVRMGYDLAQEFPEARRVFEEVNEALSFNLSHLLWEGTQEEVTLTENAQPALLAHSIAVFRVLKKELGWSLAETVQFAMGHSLGEYSALCAADCLSLWDAARLVRVRGQAMQRAVAPGKGGMAAFFPIDLDTANIIAEEASHATSQVCQVANINSPTQVVLSGTTDAIEEAVMLSKKDERFKKTVRVAKRLQVSAPFHCSLMKGAADELEAYIKSGSITFSRLTVPVISNVSARNISLKGDDEAEEEKEEEKITKMLVQQVTAPVRWSESVQWCRSEGATEFWELGPGKTLCGLVKQIDGGSTTLAKSVETAEDVAIFCKSFC
ncbi:Malonyl CoA-acyl carrier protein transacylase [Balamuthia mandrillaris]